MQHSHLTVLHSEWPKLYGVLAVFECNRVIIANVGCKVLIKITLLLSHKGPKKKKKIDLQISKNVLFILYLIENSKLPHLDEEL